jgi:serine/threonine protein kinase
LSFDAQNRKSPPQTNPQTDTDGLTASECEAADKTMPTIRTVETKRRSAQDPIVHTSAQNPASNSAPNQDGNYSDKMIGTVIADRYKLLSFLGKGGMSTVYRAEHVLTKKIVALKTMNPQLMSDGQNVRRFQQEATAAGRLSHPNAISVHDMGITDDGQPFLTMDYLEGISLSDVVRDTAHLPSLERALKIFIQACDAIQEAHEKGIIHRDIKPSNVMLIHTAQNPDFVKVLDFGIAKITQEGAEKTRLTSTGEVFGSPTYMSPEQCQGKELDARSDVYSMGCLMYEVLTGEVPHQGLNVLDTMYKQMNEMPAGLQILNQDPRQVKDIENIVMKALEKDPTHRFSTMAELRNALQLILNKKYRGSQTVAKAAMNLNQLWRTTTNKLGPSRKLILSLVAIIVAVSVFTASMFISPVPKFSQRYIPYEVEKEFAQRATNEGTRQEALRDNATQLADLWSNESQKSSDNPGEKFYAEKQLGESFFRKRNFPAAIDHFNRAKAIAQAHNLSLLLDFAEIAAQMGYASIQMGKDEGSNDCLKAARIFNFLGYEASYEGIYLWSTLGHYYESKGEKDNSTHDKNDSNIATGCCILFASKWLNNRQRVTDHDIQRSAIQAVQAADLLNRQKPSPAEIENCLREVSNLLKTVNVKSVPPNAIFAFSPGKQEQKAQATVTSNTAAVINDLYNFAISNFEKQGLESSFDVAAVYNNFGLTKLENDDYAGAKACFQRARSELAKVKQSDDKAVALVMFSQADVEWHDRQYQESLQDSMRARAILSRARFANQSK